MSSDESEQRSCLKMSSAHSLHRCCLTCTVPPALFVLLKIPASVVSCVSVIILFGNLETNQILQCERILEGTAQLPFMGSQAERTGMQAGEQLFICLGLVCCSKYIIPLDRIHYCHRRQQIHSETQKLLVLKSLLKFGEISEE